MHSDQKITAERLQLLTISLAKKGIGRAEQHRIPTRAGGAAACQSYAQQRLWLLDRLDPGAPTYNIPLAIDIDGPCEPVILERCFDELIRRHEVLRTSFSSSAEYPLQQVASPAPFKLALTDLSAVPEAERDTEIARRVARSAEQRFDLEAGAPLNVELLQAGQRNVLIITLHHIIADGWSLGILFKEIGALFAAFRDGAPSPLPPLAIQYADFAEWERATLTREALATQIDYWRGQLNGVPEVMSFPTDRARGASTGSAGASASITIGAATAARLRTVAAAGGATPFMLYLAAFKALVARYSGESDIVIGTPVWNREHPDVEPLIGFFVNTLVLRTDLGRDPGFDELLGRVRHNALAAFAHSELPFEQLVDELGVERHSHEVPLIRMMFTLAREDAPRAAPAQLSWRQREIASQSAKFDLTMSVVEGQAGDVVAIEYKSDLFDASTIARLLGHFEQLLACVAEAPHTKLSQLALLSDAERALQLQGWSHGAAPHDAEGNVCQWFEQQAALAPHALALADGERHLSYGELERRANQLAHYLLEQGVLRGDVVAIAMQRSAEMGVAMLAILRAGAAFLPLDVSHPPERLAGIATDAGARLVLTRGADAAILAGAALPLVCVDACAAAISAQPDSAPGLHSGPGDLAYVIYTSGSTGRPKGVEVAHGALANLVAWQRRAFAVTAFDRASQLAGPAFDASLVEWWANLCSGASVHLVDDQTRMQPQLLIAWLAAQRITIAFMPTPLLEASLNEAWPAGMALRALFVGGDALRRRPPAGLPFKVFNMYGPTECAVVSTCSEVLPGAEADGAPNIGRPIDGASVYVLDENMALVPAGVAGELYIGGAGLALGYRNDAAQTAQRFVPDPFGADPAARLYRSGDLVRYRADGELEFLGRADDQVKIRGYRVELGDIENALYQVDGIGRAAVLVRCNDADERYLAAYVELPATSELGEKQLRQALRARLPGYMIPAAIFLVPQFPLTGNGKVDKVALAALANHAQVEVAEQFYAPETALQQSIAEVWCEVLKREQVDIYSNFFELGGNSLLATQIVGRLNKLLDAKVSLLNFFDEPTIAGLAGMAGRGELGERDDSAPPLESLERSGPDGNRFAQSFAQQRLWFLEQLDPNSATYNVPNVLFLEGQLDVLAFQASIDQIVQRHEILRTRFTMELGTGKKSGAVQTVAPHMPVNIHFTNLETLPDGEREGRARKLVAQEVERPFNLVDGPAMRVTLVRLMQDKHILVINMHHLITDAWSMSILMRELSALYLANCRGAAANLPALPIQYADFAVWQKDWLQFGVLEEMLYYWQQKLLDAPASIDLLTDRRAPVASGNRGGSVGFSVGKEVAAGLRQIAFKHNASLFMVLLSGFKAMLARYSAQADIVVGTPIASRNREELENLIGFFVNTLVLRTDLAGDPQFGEIVARVRKTALDAFAHQDLPYERLVERLEPERRWGKSPLFNMMFVLQNAPDSTLTLEGLQMQPLAAGASTAKFDLTLTMQESADAFDGVFDYRADLFDDAMIARMVGHFEQLLACVAAAPHTKLSQLALLSDAERALQLQGWSHGAAPHDAEGNVCQWFEQQAALAPHALALADGERHLSYGELERRANQLAHYLLEQGVLRGDVVAIAMQRSAEMGVAMLAILRAGAAFLPLDVSHPPERLAGIATDAGARLVLTRGADAAILAGAALPLVCVDACAAAISAQPDSAPGLHSGPGDLAYVIYTSGSTGRPKGVEVAHGALANLVAWQRRAFAVTAFDRASQLAGPAFDASLVEWWANLCSGASVHLVDDQTRMQPQLLIAWLAAQRITIAFMPTPLLEASLNEAWPAGMALRALFVGGDALRRRPPAGLPFKVFNMYGPTECAVVSTCSEVLPGAEADGAPNIGRPIDGASVYVLDENMALVPAGVAGELYIGGAGLALGYRNDAAQTAQRFVPDPFGADPAARLYRSGDLVRYRADGELEFLGRADDQVKIRGYRVELGEIENVLLEQPGVAQATTMVFADVIGEKRIAAFVVLDNSDDAPAQVERLLAALGQRLASFMIPASLEVLERLPLTANGKIDRRALPKPRGRMDDGGSEHLRPQDELERALANIWAHLLDYKPVMMDDHFFKNGGHSLLALQLKSSVQEEFGVNLSLMAMLENPTPAHLVEQIRALQQDEGAPKKEAALVAVVATRPAGALSRVVSNSLGRLKSLLGGAPAKFSTAMASKALVPLKRGGEAAPLFLVHPIGGGVSCYAELCSALGAAQPVYGLQAPEQGDMADLAIEDLAELYIGAVKSVQPLGPYRLGGWSLGGVVAFEMAQQLRQRDEEVAVLALLDSFPFKASEEHGVAHTDQLIGRFAEDILRQLGIDPSLALASLEQQGAVDGAPGSSPAELLRQAFAQLQSIRAIPPELDFAGFETRWKAYHASYDAWCCYTAKPYAGKLSLIMAADSVRDEQQDLMSVWPPLAAGGFSIEVLAGDHYSLLRGAALAITAARLGSLLEADHKPAKTMALAA